MSLGAKGFFIKPFFTNQELVKTIEAALTEEDS
jgi:FixJ family two-component response regulator